MAYESRLSLVIDSRTAEASLRRTERQLDRTERAGEGVSRVMGGMRTAIGLAAAAAGGLSFGRLIRETASFEDSMLGLKAVSRATAAQMQQLEKQARTLGATSMFSAKQAGDAQRFLAQAGLEVNDVLSATPGILRLASAGQMDLAQAADIASNVLGGMRLEVDQLNRVNDVLAATAAGSNTSVTQLGEALSTAAPLAAAAGISIEEAAAAIGVLSDAGIQASRAGTGLQGVIRQLSNVTPQAEAALAGYGLTLEQVNVETHGLSAVLETLQGANISTADAFKIFGSEAGAAAQILVNGNARLEEFTGTLGDAEGEAERMANVIGSGLTGSMRGFNSMLSETLINLGKDEGVAGGFQSVIDTGSGLLAVYNDLLPEFAEANDLTDTQTQRLELMASGLQAATGSVVALAGAYGTATLASGTLTVATRALNAVMRANPIIAVGTAAVALGGALYGARDAMVTFGDTTASVHDWMRGTWVTTSELFATSMGAAFDEVQRSMGGLTDYLGGAWGWMSETFVALMGNIGGIAEATVNGVIAYFMTLRDTVGIVGRSIRDAFANSFSATLSIARGFWESLKDVFSGDLSFSAFKSALQEEIVDPLAGAAGEIRESFESNFGQDYLGDSIDWMGEAIRGFGEDVSDAAFAFRFAGNEGEAAADSFEKLGLESDDASDKLDPLRDELDRAGGAAGDAAKATASLDSELDTLRRRLRPGYAEAERFAQGLNTVNIALAAGRISMGEYAELVRMLQGEMQGADDSIRDLGDTNADITDEMTRAWERASDDIDRAFADAFAGAFDSFESFADRLQSAFQRLLAELAYQATLRPIVVGFTSDLGGMLGIPGMGGQGGFGQTLAAARGLGNSAGSILGLGSSLGAAGSAATGYAGSGFASQVATGGYTGWAGSAAAGSAAAGGGFMSAVGSAMPWIGGALAIDSILGGPISEFIGGLFSSKSKPSFQLSTVNSLSGMGDEYFENQSSGVYGEGAFGSVGFYNPGTKRLKSTFDGFENAQTFLQGIADMDTLVAGLAEDEKQLEAMAKTAQSIQFERVGSPQGISDQLFQRYAAIINETDSRLAASISTDVDELERTIGSISIGDGYREAITRAEEITRVTLEDSLLKSMSELDPEPAINALVSVISMEQIGDAIGGAVTDEIYDSLEGLEGGALTDQINSLKGAVEVLQLMDASAERLNLQFDATAQGALTAADSLAQMAGGTQNLSAVQQGYYQAVYSETERLTHQQSDLAAAFQGVSEEVPTTTAELRAMVEGADLSTEAGQELALQLMQLAPALAQTSDAVERALTEAYQEHLDRAPDAAGLEYWMDAVVSGATTLEQALEDIANSAEAAAGANLDGLLSQLGDASRTRRDQLRAELDATRGLHRSRIEGLRAEQSAVREAYQAASDAQRQALEQQRSDLETVRQAAGDAHTALMDGLNAEIDTVSQAISVSEGVISSLQGALDTLLGNQRESQLPRYQSAITELTAMRGGNVDPERLDRLLGVVTADTRGLYASFDAWDRQQGLTNNLLADLESEAAQQLSIDELQLESLETQARRAERRHEALLEYYDDRFRAMDRQHEERMEALERERDTTLAGITDSIRQHEERIAQAQTQHDREVARLNAQLDYWERQVQLAQGTYQATLGVGQAVNSLAAAMGSSAIAASAGSSSGSSVPGFAEGGIATGPMSGYPVELHGREAVIPLRGGDVPVDLRGGFDIGPLVDEIKALRRQVAKLEAYGYEQTKVQKKGYKIQDRWDRFGVPQGEEVNA